MPSSLLPLVGKELREQAARKRTYVTRVLFALGLFGVFGTGFFVLVVEEGLSGIAVVGKGRELFDEIVMTLFLGVYVFLPAMMAGTIAEERERGCFDLLLLTDLRTGGILCQKFVGRLVPFLSLLLLSLPTLAVAYSLGGLTVQTFWSAVYLLLATCLQVGAIALMCSALCSTTANAFIGTYLVGAAIMVFIPDLLALAGRLHLLPASLVPALTRDRLYSLFGLGVFSRAGGETFLQVLGRSLPLLASALVCLIVARAFLVRRLNPGKAWPIVALWRRISRLLASGPVLAASRSELPTSDPVAWRAAHRGGLGRPGSIVWCVLLAATPATFLWAAGYATEWRLKGDFTAVAEPVWLLTWAVALTTIGVGCAAAIPRERNRGTLDLLVASPLAGGGIVESKMRGMWGLTAVCCTGLVGVIALQGYWRGVSEFDPSRSWWRCGLPGTWWNYVLYLCVCVVFYPRLLAWAAAWIGIRASSTGKAIVAVLGLAAAMCAVPAILCSGIPRLSANSKPLELVLWTLSPLARAPEAGRRVWLGNHTVELDLASVLVSAKGVWCGLLLVWVRRACLARADRHLGLAREPAESMADVPSKRHAQGRSVRYSVKGMLFDCVVISLLCGTVAALAVFALSDSRRSFQRERESTKRLINQMEAQNRLLWIGDGIRRLLAEQGLPGLYVNPQAAEGQRQLVLLAVGRGEIPALGSDVEPIWGWPYDGVKVDRLDHHLAYNTPGGRTENAYPSWRGAYLSFVSTDPWGNRYMVNAGHLPGGDSSPWDVVVLSAGSDGKVDSRFTQDGFVAGGDDMVHLVSPGGVTRRDRRASVPAWACGGGSGTPPADADE